MKMDAADNPGEEGGPAPSRAPSPLRCGATAEEIGTDVGQGRPKAARRAGPNASFAKVDNRARQFGVAPKTGVSLWPDVEGPLGR
jgi:hypothetical protein